MLSASNISVAQYTIFLLWKTLLYILLRNCLTLQFLFCGIGRSKCVPCLWCNYSQYYEETWSLSFVRNRYAHPVALFICSGLLRQDRALLLLFFFTEHFTKQCHSAPLARHVQDHLDFSPSPFFFVQARMRRNIPESDSETIIRKLLKILHHQRPSGVLRLTNMHISSLVLTSPRSVEQQCQTGNQLFFFFCRFE